MCGIGGIISKKGNNSNLKTWIAEMSETLAHRGPDDEGFLLINEYGDTTAGGKSTPQNVWQSETRFRPEKKIDENYFEPNTALLHRRLSIIDVTAQAHQPFCSHDGGYWIIFNGEIYNYIELREELKKDKFIFISNSDTEVVLNAYIRWGKDCTEKFNGMWSFAIFDKYKNELFCSRDRFGVKPFYYYNSEDYFAFASEPKALLKLPFVVKKANAEMLFDFIVLNKLEHNKDTMLKDIKMLTPANNLVYNCNTHSYQINQYYNLQHVVSKTKINEKNETEISEKILHLLNKAVRLRLRSDVPLGTCLSGGIDSSAIVKLIHQLGIKNQKVFSSIFPNLPIDESGFAKLVVDETNAIWHTCTFNGKDFLNEFERIIYANDFPIASASTFTQFKVMELSAKNNVKVVLDGQGADELFAGYDPYYASYWNELFKTNLRVLYKEIKMTNSPYNFKFWINKNAKLKWLNIFPEVYRNIGINKFIDKKFWNKYNYRLQEFGKDYYTNLNEHLMNSFTGGALSGLLKYEDRCSMWHSVEARTPFADDIELIEYVHSLNSQYKIKQGLRKYILRKSLKNIVPDAILNRKDKKGFLAPTHQWIKENSEIFLQQIHPEIYALFEENILKNNLKNAIQQLPDEDTYTLLKIFSTSVWLKKFNLSVDI
jgi:asparagine synthase (glutamine-hydrolysing)